MKARGLLLLITLLCIVGISVSADFAFVEDEYIRIESTTSSGPVNQGDTTFAAFDVFNVSAAHGNPGNITISFLSLFLQKQTITATFPTANSVTTNNGDSQAQWTNNFIPTVIPPGGISNTYGAIATVGNVTGLTNLLVSVFAIINTPAGTRQYTVEVFIPVVPTTPTISNKITYNNGANSDTLPFQSNPFTNFFVSMLMADSGNPANAACHVCSLPQYIFGFDPQSGHSVNLFNLSFQSGPCTINDMTIAGRGLDVEIKRFYRSDVQFNGPMGQGWEYLYNMRVVPVDSTKVLFYDGRGRGDEYMISGNSFIAPNDQFRKMIKDTDNSILLREANGLIYRFFPLNDATKPGKLASITTRCANQMTFQYNASGQLVTILDSLSRAIFHEYDTNGRIVKIRDFTGREITYTYDTNGDLVEVTSPAITGTPNGNDFPTGKKWRYTYSSGFSDPKLNHNLISVFAPNETSTSGNPMLVNFYNAADELIRQQWSGTNDSGVPAGGDVTFARQLVNQSVPPGNPDIARIETIVIDRNNNETVFSINEDGHLIRKEELTRGIRPGDPISYVTQYKYTDTGLLRETIFPENNRELREFDENNNDQFQRGNLLSITQFPDATRGGDQTSLQRTFSHEPVYNQVLTTTDERLHTTQFTPDYFEGGLDTACSCGHTLRELVDKFQIDISSVQSQLNQGDRNEDSLYSLCGNTILVTRPNVTLRSGSPQIVAEGGTTQISETRISYNKFSQLNFTETPEGEISEFIYAPENDPDNDGQDIATGNNNAGQPFDTSTGGYLKKVIVDQRHTTRYRGTALPTQLTAEVFYDRVGNTIGIKDGRGVKTTFAINQLNEVVEVTRAADVSAATEPGLVAHAYKSRIFRDANGNIVRTETEYKDGNNTNLPQFIESTAVYDILNKPVETTRRVSNSETVTIQLRYDANENLIETRSPLAVDGSEPANKVQFVYDERDLLFKTIRAPGAPEESITTCNRDNNGNKTQYFDAEDNNNDGQPDVTTMIFDGFDRIRRTISAVGDEARVTYDPASNVITSEVFGSIGGPSRNSNSTTGNVLLAREHAQYDELNRTFQRDAKLFVSSGVIPIRPPLLTENDLNPSDGQISSFVDFDRNSRISFLTEASPASAQEITKVIYDGASRIIEVEDAESNKVQTQYDKNSNATRITRIDRNPSDRVPQETFVTLNVFDSLNRISRSTDNLGQTRRIFYDSRNLAIKSTDAQGNSIPDNLGLFTGGNINDNGNVMEAVHDGLGRAIQMIRELRQNGQGGNPLDFSNPSNADGKITENTVWDKNSRVTSVSDDKANTTTYGHDNLNRTVLTNFADSTTKRRTFDRDSNVRQTIDNNGTIVTNIFDAINRLTSRTVARSVSNNVEGTTLQAFEYDGLSRLTKATDNNDPANLDDDSLVERRYDSLTRLLEEVQNGKVINTNWREDDDIAELIYPNGRKITYTQDKLDRLKTIANQGAATVIAAYDYIGNRLLERVYANGTRLSMLNDAGNQDVGYDALPRLVQLRHLKSNNDLIAGYKHDYNRENMKLNQQNLTHPQFSEVYKLDSVYRIADFQRGTLNATRDAVVGTPSQTQAWQLDGVGNWANTVVDGVLKTQTVNNMNEYDAFAGVPNQHDDNGNLKDDGERVVLYDFANRPVEIRNKQDGSVLAKYQYDAMNRRIVKEFTRSKQVSNGGQYITDGNTIALYHFNETTGDVLDSSANDNHGTPPRHIQRGVEGLFGTFAVKFQGQPIRIKKSASLNNVQDKLTVETFVFLASPECKRNWQGGNLIHRPGSYKLRIDKRSRKASFTIYVQKDRQRDDEDGDEDDDCDEDDQDNGHNRRERRKVVVRSDSAIPFDEWVHIASVYNGSKVTLFVNGSEVDQKAAKGDVRKTKSPLFLGGNHFQGKMEEARISNTNRTVFAGTGVGTIRESVLRKYFYDGWRIVEEREQTAPVGELLGAEVLTRQHVDGAGIDEHLTQDRYDVAGASIAETIYYHENSRGDTVALTDASGNTTLRLEYDAYGSPSLINALGQLENFTDGDTVTYLFQGRQIDSESGYYYFRNRYYDSVQGRFLQRDSIEYGDSMNLYEGFGGMPANLIDPLGNKIWNRDTQTWELDDLEISKIQQLLVILNELQTLRSLFVENNWYLLQPVICAKESSLNIWRFVARDRLAEIDNLINYIINYIFDIEEWEPNIPFPMHPAHVGSVTFDFALYEGTLSEGEKFWRAFINGFVHGFSSGLGSGLDIAFASRQFFISAAIGREAQILISTYGKTTGKLAEEITKAAREMGFTGEVIVLKGAGSGKIGAAITPSGEMIVFETAYKEGIKTTDRFLKGKEILAHEIGHTRASLSAALDLGRQSSQYWLREAQASAIGATLPGLTAAQRKVLVQDMITALRHYRRSGGKLKK